MTRQEDLRSDAAFGEAVQAVRGVASIMYGTEMSKEEAERDCQEFRVRAAIVAPQEVTDGTTQSSPHP
jgi:hypothetical protein